MRLFLPERDRLRVTSEEDPLEFYYRFPHAWAYRKRLRMALELLGERRRGSLLEIGTGSGILIPSLARICRRYTGIDIHQRLAGVAAAAGVPVALARADARRLPFAGETFDSILCLSVLEFLDDADAAVGEMARVLAPGGTVVAGFPALNRMTDILYALCGNRRHKSSHLSSHRVIIDAFRRRYDSLVIRCFPSFAPPDRALFICVKAGGPRKGIPCG